MALLLAFAFRFEPGQMFQPRLLDLFFRVCSQALSLALVFVPIREEIGLFPILDLLFKMPSGLPFEHVLRLAEDRSLE